jgi:ribonuclease HI
MSKWRAWFDGAFPNGRSTFGFVLKKEGEVIRTHNDSVRLLSNEETVNVAEYGGLIEALDCARKWVQAGDELEVLGDSQLVIRQMNGQYRVKKANLLLYVNRAKSIVAVLKQMGVEVTLTWIRREENCEADRLSKEPL